MALTAGTRLGPYEILAPIGAGEVYRARDTGFLGQAIRAAAQQTGAKGGRKFRALVGERTALPRRLLRRRTHSIGRRKRYKQCRTAPPWEQCLCFPDANASSAIGSRERR